MKYRIELCGWLLGLSLLSAACGGTEGAKSPSEGGATRQTLSANGECRFESCGVLPSSLSSVAKVECSADSSAACAWTEPPPSTTVSFRQCADSECPPKPGIECPSDTVQSSQYCGSENDAACAWTTVCVPPRITTPCPQADGCSDQEVITIGIICKDGSTGGMTCVTDGERCFMERNCD
jgi:hypothetical protein